METLIDKDEIEKKAWIVLAPFCAMGYVNTASDLPGGTTLDAEGLKNLIRTKCTFCKVGLRHRLKFLVALGFSFLKRYELFFSVRRCLYITEVSTNFMDGVEPGKIQLFFKY